MTMILSKILIADDSALAAKVQETILWRQGYEVIVARDGIEAVQAVYTERPDLVLLDIFMPRMNGYQVCRLLKNDPVVINTASDAREAEFWSRHTGADAFLLKGSFSSELLSVVERLLPSGAPGETGADIALLSNSNPPAPGPEEILSQFSALADQELHNTTVQRVHLQTILENLCEGILTLDGEGRVVSANRFFCRLVGETENELAGCPVDEALSGEAGAFAHEMFREALAGEEVASRDSEVRDKAGRITPISINVASVRDYLGEVVGCVALFQDITRRKQVESLSQLKNDLTCMIVHDLRTPLTSLLTGLQTFDLMGEVNQAQQEMLDIALGGGETLLRMINDLLDISKMEDGSLRLERRQLHAEALLSSALQQVMMLSADKKLDLSHEIALGVGAFWGDEDKLLRSLVNLLSNAVKFTPHNGSVTLEVQLAPMAASGAGAAGILVTVRDTGEGIPESAFERIFEKFGQSESRKAGRKMSSGLGLTFCKMVVEAHGGNIWVQSLLGEGSTFSFVLPHRASDSDRRICCTIPYPHSERRIGPHDRRASEKEAEAYLESQSQHDDLAWARASN